MSVEQRVTEIRLDHPIVDGDGHIVESLPIVIDYIRRVAGDDVADRFAGSSPAYASRHAPLLTEHHHRPAPGNPITPWWALPANALDRATGLLPKLLYERLDEIGIDFTVLYSSVGLACLGHADDAIRHGACRGLNTYLAEMLDGFGDRMTAAAVIPTHTPDEAIAELEHAVNELGFKAVMLNSLVARPLPERGTGAQWLDVLALDSIYDYDPLWARCVELGVAVTVHSPSQGLGLRASSSRYMFNHIGNFAASSDAFAKAVFFGGVGHRFPSLHFAFLECGVSWGVQLLCDLIDRWHKRGGANIERLDPGRLDRAEWDRLLSQYGGERFADPEVRQATLGQSDNPPDAIDDFRACGVTTPSDIVTQFDRFFFGCEADDATISWAFADRVNPLGAMLQPMLGSDIGHWDVPDMRDVLPEALELVEHQLLSLAQFREFSCDNAIRLHGGMNPHFFDGTRVEAYASDLLARPAVEPSPAYD
ncbi:MAG TPA: amidohydrolase family protein [Acidimicrobiales bacterium]|nr:amidohydrolase family protein [Acidimicrobiales bacterium]